MLRTPTAAIGASRVRRSTGLRHVVRRARLPLTYWDFVYLDLGVEPR